MVGGGGWGCGSRRSLPLIPAWPGGLWQVSKLGLPWINDKSDNLNDPGDYWVNVHSCFTSALLKGNNYKIQNIVQSGFMLD